MNKLPPTVAVFRYRPACVLRVTGSDAAAFLQGQFSNDLGRNGPGQSTYGLWLDRKGHVIADSHVVQDADAGTFWVLSLSSAAEAIVQRLEGFVVADDVAFEDRTAGWGGLSLVGCGAGAWLASEARPGLCLPGRRALAENWEWLCPDGKRESADAAVPGARALSAEDIERMRVDSRIPSVPRDIGPRDLPQEGGLEEAAISYSKGCYLGQEVMARLKSRGSVRRTLVRVSGPGAPPGVPAVLWRGEGGAGELRSVVRGAGGQGFVGLALISASAASSGEPLSLARGGPPVLGVARGPDCV